MSYSRKLVKGKLGSPFIGEISLLSDSPNEITQSLALGNQASLYWALKSILAHCLKSHEA